MVAMPWQGGRWKRWFRPSWRDAVLALIVAQLGAFAWWWWMERCVPPYRTGEVPGVLQSLSWSKDANRIAGTSTGARSPWVWDLRSNHVALVTDDPAFNTHVELAHPGGMSPYAWSQGPSWSPTNGLLLVGEHVYDPEGHLFYDNYLPVAWGQPLWMPDGETMVCQCREEWHVTTMTQVRCHDRAGFPERQYLPLSAMDCSYYPSLMAVAPDGNDLALEVVGGGGVTVFLWNWKERNKPRQVVGPATWSRLGVTGGVDTRHLVFMKSGTVLVDAIIRAEGESSVFAFDGATGKLRRICKGSLLEASRTRDECAIWRKGGVRIINSGGWMLARLGDTGTGCEAAAWSPDGNQIALGVGTTVCFYRIH